MTSVPEEAAGHADVILIGEAEGLWQKYLYEFEQGCPTRTPSLYQVPHGRIDLFHRKDYTNGILLTSR
mgnify:CR=1 FL=1|uniref:Uncharacterized protein n=1 Tax=Anaerolinea thermolimosa TaxID=229919 RepID=A0A7C4PKE2_9CHLR